MVEERVQRRLAAILAADVAGYSRLMGADEEGTLAALKAHRRELIDPTIAAHNGRIVKTTGDGALVEFASVVDAVRCAIEIQRAMAGRNADVPEDRRIAFRIGINVGDIIIDGDDIYGDGVNVAARLETLAEPSSICISRGARDQVRDRLKLALEDLGEQSVKNIARPVRVYRIDPTTPSTTETPQAPQLAVPEKPSIAVLPFQNISGDPEQDYFADGMVEDIITGLARIKWLFVIARNSTFAYKGKSPDIRQVGRDLGVRYVLEGSVRKAGGRVRITGQLIEAESGAHLWADRYDGALEDVFDLQDRITEAIVGILEPNLRLAEIERARRKPPDSLGAYDLYLRALPHLMSVMPGEANIGVGYLEEALTLDPNYATAHAYISWAMEIRVMRGGFNEADVRAGVRHARAALAYGSDDASALTVAAIALLHLGHDFAAASNAIARALSLNGSCAIAYFFGAHIHAFSGDSRIAEDYAEQAMRLSPFDPFTFLAHFARGCVRLRDGRFDDAASLFFSAVQANPRFSVLHTCQAAALAMADRVDEAKAAAGRVLELEPTFRIKPFVEFVSTFVRPELAAPLSTGLRQTGLPD
jgi:adenylate cyclase